MATDGAPAQGMRVVAYKALVASTIMRKPIRKARTSSGMELPRQKAQKCYGPASISRHTKTIFRTKKWAASAGSSWQPLCQKVPLETGFGDINRQRHGTNTKNWPSVPGN